MRPLRPLAVLLILLGVVLAIVGTFSGCGSLFSWNGRHELSVEHLSEDRALHHVIQPEAGRRYTLSIEVVFDREGLPKREGVVQLEAKLPLVVTVKDSSGTALSNLAGWIDPNEPPNVLHGQNVPDVGARTPELEVVRLVGPFGASSTSPIGLDVNLGPDRIGTAKILERRLVIHDDALPARVRNAFIFAAVGVAAFLGGIVLLVVAYFRRRAPKRTAASLVADPPRPDA